MVSDPFPLMKLIVILILLSVLFIWLFYSDKIKKLLMPIKDKVKVKSLNKSFYPVLFSFFVAIILIITNPDKYEIIDDVKEDLIEYMNAKTILLESFNDIKIKRSALFNNNISIIAINIARGLTIDNYIIFSIIKSELGSDIEVIGIGIFSSAIIFVEYEIEKEAQIKLIKLLEKK